MFYSTRVYQLLAVVLLPVVHREASVVVRVLLLVRVAESTRAGAVVHDITRREVTVCELANTNAMS